MFDLSAEMEAALRIIDYKNEVALHLSKFGAAFDIRRATYLHERRHLHADLTFLDECIRRDVLNITSQPVSGMLGVPPRIVQFWDHPTPQPEIDQLIAITRQINPDCQHFPFDLASARAYVADHFGCWVLGALDTCRHIASKADIFRLCWLYERGGIYLDADELCVTPFSQFLSKSAEVSVSFVSGQPSCLPNGFIAAQPRSRLLLRTLALAVASINQMAATGTKQNAWLLTGPGPLTMAVLDDIAINGRLTICDHLSLLPDNHLRMHIHCVYDLPYKQDAIGNWRL